jgi:hypothetical protein
MPFFCSSGAEVIACPDDVLLTVYRNGALVCSATAVIQ